MLTLCHADLHRCLVYISVSLYISSSKKDTELVPLFFVYTTQCVVHSVYYKHIHCCTCYQ